MFIINNADNNAKSKNHFNTKTILILLLIIIIIITGLLLVYSGYIKPAINYSKAVKAYKQGDYKQAYSLFLLSNNYKDSEKLCNEAKVAYKKQLLSSAEIGSKIIFGSYEQDGNLQNGTEDIEWTVIARDGNQIIVISDCLLDMKPYNDEADKTITWENSSLRQWLNGSFFNSAFSPEEQDMIPLATVTPDKHPDDSSFNYELEYGEKTEDRVYILSLSEKEALLNDELSQCAPSEYLWNNNTFLTNYNKTKDGKTAVAWWLRTTGPNPGWATCVNSSGYPVEHGYVATSPNICVRPVIRIELSDN